MRERGYAEKAAATACIGFTVFVGVMIRRAVLLVVLVSGRIGVGMRRPAMLGGVRHPARRGQAMKNGRTISRGQRSSGRHDAKRISHGNQDRRSLPQFFSQTMHRACALISTNSI